MLLGSQFFEFCNTVLGSKKNVPNCTFENEMHLEMCTVTYDVDDVDNALFFSFVLSTATRTMNSVIISTPIENSK